MGNSGSPGFKSCLCHSWIVWLSINLSLFLDLEIKGIGINQFVRFPSSDKMIP